MFWKNAAANRLALPLGFGAAGLGLYAGFSMLNSLVSGGYDMTRMTSEYGWNPGTALQGWNQPMSFVGGRTSFEGLNSSGAIVFGMHNRRKA